MTLLKLPIELPRKKMNKEILIPLLNDEYEVCVCWGTEEFVDKVGQTHGYGKGEVKLHGNVRGIIWENPGLNPIIVLPRFPRMPAEYGTLAHEASHAIIGILEKIGANIDREIIGYSIGAVVRKTLQEGKL